jgi:hypothetical protein
LSHPFDFVEGAGQYVSTIRRCEHGVYRPSFSVDSDPNPVCSICQMPIAAKQAKRYQKLKSKNSRLVDVATEIEEEDAVEQTNIFEEAPAEERVEAEVAEELVQGD